MTTRTILIAALLGLLLNLAGAPLVAAHPLGNFSVNRYSRLEIGPERASLRYVLDLAEIPTLQELQAVGIDPARVSTADRERLLSAKARELTAGARLALDGRPVEWSLEQATLELPEGQGGLPTMRVTLMLGAPLAGLEQSHLTYRDANYPGRIGWHEIVLRGVDGAMLAESSAPADDQSDELRRYPDDPTSAPLDRSAASATLRPGATSAAAAPASSLARGGVGAPRFATDPVADRLLSVASQGAGPTPLSLLLSLAVAAAFGAMHALGPGHGKSVVAAYLVGSRGTARQAALLGLTVTVTHTAGVYALGVVTLVAAQYVLPERLYPVLGVVSGLLVVTIGLGLARSRLRAAIQATAPPGHHVHEPGGQARHTHGPASHQHHHHHDHEPDHDHGENGHVHRHCDRPHSHLPPSGPITLRSLVALGVSGGLVPCPSALVVLLAAISFHNTALGLALVAAFSVGLAGVLTVVGILVVYGGRWLGRTPLAVRAARSPLVRLAPALSALAITVAGLMITVQSARPLF